MVNYRFTDVNGNSVNLYDVPMTDATDDYGEPWVDMVALLEREDDEDILRILDNTCTRQAIDDLGNLI